MVLLKTRILKVFLKQAQVGLNECLVDGVTLQLCVQILQFRTFEDFEPKLFE